MMNEKNRFFKILSQIPSAFVRFYFAGVLALALVMIVQVGTLENKWHPGFLSFDNGLVFGLVDSEWPGAKAGLETYDWIKKIDGESFSTVKDLQKHVQNGSGSAFNLSLIHI